MDYQLHRQGQNLGTFPLEELRRRRQGGELAGDELVWCEGMADWQALDAVLQQNAPVAPQAPPPIPPMRPASNRKAILLTVGAVILFMGLVTLVTVHIVKVAKNHALFPLPISPRKGSSRNYPARNDAAMTAASKPVEISEKSVTETQMQARRREFRLRQYLEGYKLRGERNPATDAGCLGFLSNWIATRHAGVVDTNLPPLSDLADRLANDPNCTDPIVLTVTGNECVEKFEATRRFERAVKAFEKCRHKAYPKFYATCMLAKQLDWNSPRRQALDGQAVQLLQQMFQDGSLQPEDQDDPAETLVNDWGYNFFYRHAAEVVSITKAAGKSYEWLALVLEGKHQIDEAWKARGNGYANTVTEAGWKGFRDHLALANQRLSEAWKLRPDLPLAPAEMMNVALGQSDITAMRLWFDRAVAAQVDYPPAWSKMRWGLRPRWYGDRDSMLAFGITALNTRRFDTDIPRKFYDVVADLRAEAGSPPGEYIFGQKNIWPHLKEMYEGYIAAPSQADSRYGWQSTYISVAYLAGRYDVAKEQLEAVDWRPKPWNLAGWNRDLSLLPQEVAARTGALGRQVADAENRRADDDIASALELYSSLNAATNADDLTRLFIRDRLASLSLEQSVRKGGWVDFLPKDTNFAGWCVERGDFRLLPDGALEVRSDKQGHIIFSRADIGNNLEVKGQFEVVRSSTKSFQAGLVLGLPQFESTGWYGFRIKRNQDEGEVSAFSNGWAKDPNTRPVSVNLNDDTNSFTFQFVDGKVSATVNDKPAFQNFTPTKNSEVSANEFLLGLGAFNDMNDTVIRYRNVQVRQLSAR